jgi:peptide/nickel transport system permease protein
VRGEGQQIGFATSSATGSSCRHSETHIFPSHPLGTDDLGRDAWSRLVYGARIDLRIAFLAVFSSFLIGTIIGLVSGYYGGAVDTFASWLVNVVVAFPFYVLIIALVFVLVSGTRNIYIAIILVGWVSYTRIIRGEVLVAMVIVLVLCWV